MFNKVWKVIDKIDKVLEIQSKNIGLISNVQNKTTDIIMNQQQEIEYLEARIITLEKQIDLLMDKTYR